MLSCFPVSACVSVAPFAGAWIEISRDIVLDSYSDVAPFAGAWIEIHSLPDYKPSQPVAPFAGAWIEIIRLSCSNVTVTTSLPSRERGLKFRHTVRSAQSHPVAPFAGAWIEIPASSPYERSITVAPFAGAWIEICFQLLLYSRVSSLPSRERGLK